MNVRESFRQMASNLAKLLKKYWPESNLGNLIFEKQRKRTGSGISSADASPSQGSGSIGDIAGAGNSAVRLGRLARAMSMQDEKDGGEL